MKHSAHACQWNERPCFRLFLGLGPRCGRCPHSPLWAHTHHEPLFNKSRLRHCRWHHRRKW